MPDQPDFPPSPNFPINPPQQNIPRSEAPPPPPRNRRDDDDFGYGPPSPFAQWFGNLGISGMLLTFAATLAIFNWLVLYPAIVRPYFHLLIVLSILFVVVTLEACWILYQPVPYANKSVWLIVTICLVGVNLILGLIWFTESFNPFNFPGFFNFLLCGTMAAGIIMKAIGEFGGGGGGRRRRYDDYDDDYDDRDRRRRRDEDFDDREERSRRKRDERDEEPRRESRRDRDDFDFSDRDDDRDRRRRDR